MSHRSKRIFISRPCHEDATAAKTWKPTVRKLLSGNKQNQLRPNAWRKTLFHIRVEAILDCGMVLPTLCKRRYPPCEPEPLPARFAGQGSFDLLFQSLVTLPLFEAR
jgi:hypothetical protein